jgi:hypothetical protein
MRIDSGDYVMLTKDAVITLREQGYSLEGELAEVVDRQIVPDGIDLTLRFDTAKVLLREVPIQFVHHVALA